MATHKKELSRRDTLDIAAKAHSCGKIKKAIGEYLKLLRADPGDYDIHARLAPLLAKSNRQEEAWSSFRAAADGYCARGFLDKSQSIYTLACRTLPQKVEAWEEAIKLQVERGLKADAVQTAVESCKHLKGRLNRKKVTVLLRKVYLLAPWHPELTLCLAYNEAKEKRVKEALWLYEGIAERCKGQLKRSARLSALWLSPGLGTLSRALRATLLAR
jgi:tetratricopeptide (TPR) repeat protein